MSVDVTDNLDFTITIKNAHDLEKSFRPLQTRARIEFGVFANWNAVPSFDAVLANTIAIHGHRGRVARAEKRNIHKSRQFIRLLKEWLDMHGKEYTVQEHGDLLKRSHLSAVA